MKADKSRPKILMVDDLKENLYALEQILEDEDYELEKASSGEDALKLAWKNCYCLFLLDVQMPGIDGFEVAELLKGNKSTKNVPIIFITAISKDQHSVNKGFESGAVDYISKPVDEYLLKLKIKTMLQLFMQQKELEEARQELKEINNNLEELVVERTARLIKTNESLKNEIAARKEAQEQLIQIQEIERKRIGQEIHDGIGQLLVAAKFSLATLEVPKELEGELESIETILGDTIEESRRVIKNLSTRILDELGLDKAVEELCNRANVGRSLKINRKIKVNDANVDKRVLVATYRIIQEALNNVVKYSEAKRLTIEVNNPGQLMDIILIDDGKGFDMKASNFLAGNGLTNMRERAEAFNGNLKIESNPGKGTKIHGQILMN